VKINLNPHFLDLYIIYQVTICIFPFRKSYKNTKGKSVGGGGLLVYVRKENIVTKHEAHSSSFEKIKFDIHFTDQNMIITSIEDMESDKIKYERRSFDIIDYDKLNECMKNSQVLKIHDVNKKFFHNV